LKVIAMGNHFSSLSCSEWADLGASYPIIDDRTSAIWSEFGSGVVPRNVIIDSDGVVRYNTGGFNVSAITSIIDELLSTTSINDTYQRPARLNLISNFPNPFNSGTQINYEVLKHGIIELSIYNQSGVLVKSLVKMELNTGSYAIQWNTLDDQGESLPSGVYVVRMVSGEIQSSAKLLLLK